MTLDALKVDEEFWRGILLGHVDTMLALTASPAKLTQQEWDRLREYRDQHQAAAERLKNELKTT